MHEVRDVGVLDLDNLENCNWNKRYAYRMKIKRYLRDRFRSEYLGALMHLKRNEVGPKELSVGDVVFIGSDDAKRIDWPLARVSELIFGKDGNVRVARLKTANGELTRPLQRIYTLELDNDKINNKSVTDTYENMKKDVKSNVDKIVESEVEICKETCDKETVVEKPVLTRSGRVVKKVERLKYD